MLNPGQSQRLAKELKHMSSELFNYHGHLLMIMIDFRYKFICPVKRQMESYKENLYHLKMTKSNKNSLQQQSIYGYKYQHHEALR